jgi:hypothetical protein
MFSNRNEVTSSPYFPSVKMRFTLPAITALFLIEASVSSFGTIAYAKNRWVGASAASDLPFVTRGGSSQSTHLSASVGSTSTTQHQLISAENLELLSERGRDAVLRLIEADTEGHQRHVYCEWPVAGVEDEGKKRLVDQVRHEIMCDDYVVEHLSHCFRVS